MLRWIAARSVVAGENGENDAENIARAKRFIESYNADVRPLEIEVNRSAWTANITGKEADFQKKQAAEEKLDLCLADPKQFAELKAIKQSGVSDPLLAREIAVLYLEYLEQQIPAELMKKIWPSRTPSSRRSTSSGPSSAARKSPTTTCGRY